MLSVNLHYRFFVGHLAQITEFKKAAKNDEDPALELYIEWSVHRTTLLTSLTHCMYLDHCRYNELGNPPAFVIYFYHLPFVVISDPENIKVLIPCDPITQLPSDSYVYREFSLLHADFIQSS